MSKTATPKTNPQESAPHTWRQFQEAQKKRDRFHAELLIAVERFGTAEAELSLACDRLDRAMSTKEPESPTATPAAKA